MHLSYSLRIVLLLCLYQLSIWGLLAPAFHSSLPLDVAELTTLFGESVVANYKHPNLPGLLYEFTVWISDSLNSVYLLSQLAISTTYFAIYALSKEFIGERRALLAVLLTSTIFYYHWPTPEFNHNVLQIPLWALATVFAWRAVNTRRLVYWFLLGAVAGLMLWTKYSAGVLLLWIFVWLLATANGRASLSTLGPYISAAVFLAVSLPQLLYLFESDYLPLQYAARRASEGGIGDSLSFLAAQLLDHLFFILILLAAGLVGRGAVTRRDLAESHKRTFLLLVVVAPILFVSLLPLLSGKGLKPMWGTPMFNFSGLLLLYYFGERLNRARARRLEIGVLLVLLIVPMLYIGQHLLRADFSDKPMRTLWPQRAMQEFFQQEFRRITGKELKIIAASDWLGGTLSAEVDDKPRVKIDGSDIKSPWVTDSDVARDGALILWQGGRNSELNSFAERFGVAERVPLETSFVWHPSKADKSLVIQYIVIPPSAQ